MPILASSDQLDVILNRREEFPKAEFYSYESSNEGCERKMREPIVKPKLVE